ASGEKEFGGLSGLVVSPDGQQLWAVSDRGSLVTARLAYGEGGELVAARDIALHPLIEADGGAVTGSRSDAEDLTRMPDGSWAVAFERWHRIESYPATPDGPINGPKELPRPAGLRQAPGNGGIEALAAFPDGRLLAIEEGREQDAGTHRAWITGPDGWRRLTYRGLAPYRPTGATVLPDGDLLVLERRASLLGGFGARIVRVPGEAIEPGRVVAGEEIARLEPPLSVDNFEGIDAVPAPDGGYVVYLLSDDNFWALQRTLLLMFRLPA
ncbi:MAG TPA: esterase-like activity of phytase family protein, partial [Arenibaculum sp.]|nr:esterase-like activity of phytase family protein [Arenibaculum sp.]